LSLYYLTEKGFDRAMSIENIVPKFAIAIILLIAVPLVLGFIYNTFESRRKAKIAEERSKFESSGDCRNIYGLPFDGESVVSLLSDHFGIKFSFDGDVVKLSSKRIVSAVEMSAEEFPKYAAERRLSGSPRPGERVLSIEYRTSEAVPKALVVSVGDAEVCAALCASITHFAAANPIAADEWGKFAL